MSELQLWSWGSCSYINHLVILTRPCASVPLPRSTNLILTHPTQPATVFSLFPEKDTYITKFQFCLFIFLSLVVNLFFLSLDVFRLLQYMYVNSNYKVLTGYWVMYCTYAVAFEQWSSID